MRLFWALIATCIVCPISAFADKPYMGFSNWPSDLTQEAVERTYDFLDDYANIHCSN